MADPLMWRDGEGYDIHVLRGGPPSKPLVDSLILPAGTNAATSLSFAPQFAGAPKAPFVEVDTKTGSVTAKLHTDAAKPKIFNFLMTASLANPADGAPSETEIRVHVHDPNITEIWLTPATLTIHQGRMSAGSPCWPDSTMSAWRTSRTGTWRSSHLTSLTKVQ